MSVYKKGRNKYGLMFWLVGESQKYFLPKLVSIIHIVCFNDKLLRNFKTKRFQNILKIQLFEKNQFLTPLSKPSASKLVSLLRFQNIIISIYCAILRGIGMKKSLSISHLKNLILILFRLLHIILNAAYHITNHRLP